MFRNDFYSRETSRWSLKLKQNVVRLPQTYTSCYHIVHTNCIDTLQFISQVGVYVQKKLCMHTIFIRQQFCIREIIIERKSTFDLGSTGKTYISNNIVKTVNENILYTYETFRLQYTTVILVPFSNIFSKLIFIF